jgi:hypothetical protein
LAKKAKKTAAKSPKRKAAKKPVGRGKAQKRPSAPGKRASAKRGRSRVEKTRASKTKVAARAAATRKAQKAEPQRSRLASAAKVAAGVALLAYDEVAKRMPWAKNKNDPIALLKTDHRRFEALLKEGEDTTERARKGRREILTALTKEINVHEAIEEKLLYPALQPHAEAHDLVLESYQEHHVADMVVKELHEVSTNDEQWGAKFKVFKENLTHHISEEENKLFPIARGVLKKEELLALGKKMRALKSELEN